MELSMILALFAVVLMGLALLAVTNRPEPRRLPVRVHRDDRR